MNGRIREVLKEASTLALVEETILENKSLREEIQTLQKKLELEQGHKNDFEMEQTELFKAVFPTADLTALLRGKHSERVEMLQSEIVKMIKKRSDSVNYATHQMWVQWMCNAISKVHKGVEGEMLKNTVRSIPETSVDDGLMDSLIQGLSLTSKKYVSKQRDALEQALLSLVSDLHIKATEAGTTFDNVFSGKTEEHFAKLWATGFHPTWKKLSEKMEEWAEFLDVKNSPDESNIPQ